MSYYLCGFVHREGLKEDLVCNMETGDVVLVSSVLGNVLLSDVNIGSAVLDLPEQSYDAVMELDPEANGVIIGEEYAVLLYDKGDTGEARFYDMGDFTTPVKSVTYNYDDEVEGEINY